MASRQPCLPASTPTIRCKKILAPANPITHTKDVAASISITAGVSFSQSSQESTTSIPVPPVVRGSSVTIVAQSGDIIGRGVQISAGYGKDGQAAVASDDPNNGNILISAAGNVDLESVPATTVNSSSSSVGSVAIGYSWGFDVDKNQVSAGFTASASGSEGKSQGSSVTQVNSNAFGSNTVTVVAGDKLALAGAVLSGNTVNASAANGITIESRQDTATYDEKSQSASLAIRGGGVSGGYQKGTITGDYASVTQQSGFGRSRDFSGHLKRWFETPMGNNRPITYPPPNGGFMGESWADESERDKKW